MKCAREFALLLLAAGLAVPLTTPQATAGGPQQPPPPAANPPQGSRKVVEVRLVNVIFAVMDRHNHFVTNLDKSDFRVLEDGQPQQISFFSRETDLPLRVGMLLDTSNSIRERLRFEQDAAADFLFNVVRRAKDLAFLMTFDNEPEIVQSFTDDLDRLRNVIDKQRAGGGTALNDAIYTACQNELMAPPIPPGANPTVRRVLVVISDGEDTSSDHARSDAIETAQRAGVVIYTISTSTDWLALDQGPAPKKIHETRGDKVLDQLATETGGRAFFPYRIDDLAQSFQDIGTELRSQYSLGYTPTGHAIDGKFHRIRIEVDRKGLNVRARKGYFALPAPAPVALPPTPPGG